MALMKELHSGQNPGLGVKGVSEKRVDKPDACPGGIRARHAVLNA